MISENSFLKMISGWVATVVKKFQQLSHVVGRSIEIWVSPEMEGNRMIYAWKFANYLLKSRTLFLHMTDQSGERSYLYLSNKNY